MTKEKNRREILRDGLAAASLLATGLPRWALPAPVQGEVRVPFTDIPEDFGPGDPDSPVRIYDIRRISTEDPVTPREEFFSIAHHGMPAMDASSYRLQLTGLIESPRKLSLEDLRGRPPVELAAGFECSGNSGRRIHGLASSGRWGGIRLSELIREAGIRPEAREVVFFGADHGENEVVFRGETFRLDQQFARSLPLEKATRSEPLLAYSLNGQPLTRRQGFPLRLIVPGWYGVANVKWLTGIHLQEDRFVGHYQARWYRTVMGRRIGGEIRYTENEVTRMRLKSVIARVARLGDSHRVVGFVLNDGTPLRSVEVRVDDGPWRPAVLEPSGGAFAWKLFTFRWEGATPGEHTLISRATDMRGRIQATEEELATKQTFLEHSAQYPRRVRIT